MHLRLPFILLFFISLLFTGTGCKEKRDAKNEKAVHSPIPLPLPVKPTDITRLHPIWTEMQKKELQFIDMYARMKVKGHYDGETQSFNAEMRWQKGKQVWMSFSIFGIEGMRIVITRDSMKVIDRLNKRYFLKPFSYINERALLNINFNELENLLLGEMIMANPNASKVNETTDQYTITANTDGLVNLATFYRTPFSLKEQSLQYPAVMRNLLATFASFKPLGNTTFAWERYLRATDGTREFWAEVDFNEVSLNKNLSYPFEINTKYKKID